MTHTTPAGTVMSADTQPIELGLPRTRDVATAIVAVGVAVVLMGLVATAIELSGAAFAGREEVVTLLSLSSEFNIPTIISVLWLATCAVLLLAIARIQKARGGRFVGRWLLLSAIFGYMAIDEGARIHERLNGPLEALPITTGYLRWGWVLVGALAVVVLIPVYLPFLRALPATARNGMLVAGSLYVGGALLTEIVGAGISEDEGLSSPRYLVVTTMEETLEFAGIGLFIVVLWSLLRRWAPVLTLRHPALAEHA